MNSGGTLTVGTLLLGLVSIACGSPEPLPVVDASEPKTVSLVQLIATPWEFHQKLVRVKGFCHLEFEGNGLFLHREDPEFFIGKNGVWLSVGHPIPKERQSLSDKYVLVEGVFDADCTGHLGQWSGCLGQIQRMEKALTRDEILKGPPPSQ